MKSFAVTFVNEANGMNETIEVRGDEYILDVAEDEGLDLPFSCRAGACSACVGKVVKGQLNQSEQSFLDDAQVDEGYALLCVSYAVSDCTIATEMEDELF